MIKYSKSALFYWDGERLHDVSKEKVCMPLKGEENFEILEKMLLRNFFKAFTII